MRRVLAIVAIVFAITGASWLAYQITIAGSDVPPPPPGPPNAPVLHGGHAEGQRLEKRSWSLDYQSIVTSQDGTVATLTGVRNGEIFRKGKPYMKVRANYVIVNVVTNDFNATGPVTIQENDGKHRRRFVSDEAAYSGYAQTLTLNHPAKIESDGVHLDVQSAQVNFRTGDLKLGRIVGVY